MPVSKMLLDVLRGRGHDAVHANDLGLDRASDRVIIERARDEGRVIVTADLDYPRLLVLSMASRPGLILFRGGNYSDAEMAALLERTLDAVSPDVLAHSICVVDKRRIRLTQLPVQGGKTE
jgi:predicted nuclease of predicted toxin-antitoxin system